MIYIGIDPGLTGVVAWFDDEDEKPIPKWFQIPVKDKPGIKRNKTDGKYAAGQAYIKRQIDCFAFAEQMDATFNVLTQDHCIMMERVSTKRGTGMASAGSLMQSVGMIEGVVASMFDEREWCDTIPPNTWMKALGLHGKKNDGPNVIKDWVINNFDMPKRFNKDVADAIAIAWYNKLTNQN